jgi:hypothetical protein
LRPLRRFCRARDDVVLLRALVDLREARAISLRDLAVGNRRDPLLFAVLPRDRPPALRDFIAKRITDTHESAWGILIGLVATIGMPIPAGYKLKVAARLNSRALRADAVESITCGYLSIVLIVGLAATRLFGWWWLDSVAALALIPFLIKEARAAIRGECLC